MVSMLDANESYIVPGAVVLTKSPDKAKSTLSFYRNMNISGHKSTLLVGTALVTLPLHVIRKIAFINVLDSACTTQSGHASSLA